MAHAIASRLWCFFVIMLFFGVSPAYAANSVAVLKHDSFNESFRKKVPVIGSHIRGMMRIVGNESILPNQLSVVLPAGTATRLCVVAESQDARYFAELEYPVGDRTAEQRVLLSFPTKYGNKIKGYESRDFGVTAMLTNNCLDTNGIYLPVTWGNDDTSSKFLMLVIAGGLNIDVRVFDRSQSKYMPCARDKESPQLTAFDAECELSVSPQRGLSELVIVRQRHGKLQNDEVIKAYFP